MKKLIFASNNRHKADEIKAILGNAFSIVTLAECGIYADIPEPHQTLEENAREKSMTIYELTKTDCFSEDSGLEVDALLVCILPAMPDLRLTLQPITRNF